MQHLAKGRAFLNKHNIPCLLVQKKDNIMYLSGFTGSAGVLILTPEQAFLITDFRYIEQAEQEAKDCKIIRHGKNINETIAEVLSPYPEVAVESDIVTIEQFEKYKAAMPHKKWLASKIDSIRYIKDASEISKIRTAVQIADTAFAKTLPYITVGMSEIAVAARLEYEMRMLGASRASFATIVASGIRSALPHGIASKKIIEQGDMVTMDFGAVYEGYCSDITRTFVMGTASSRQKEIYDIVLRAQLAGVQTVQAGIKGKVADKAARDIIITAGFADYFGHGTGHSVGLAIHEEPRLSPTEENLLVENMIITVEPGIYLPNWGGVRIEDMVLVQEQGCEILTQTAKFLLEI